MEEGGWVGRALLWKLRQPDGGPVALAFVSPSVCPSHGVLCLIEHACFHLLLVTARGLAWGRAQDRSLPGRARWA